MTPCLLCGSSDLDPLYQPIGSKRGIIVYLCKCGLLQSQPVGVKGSGIPNTTADASYGNLRTGKVGRAQPNLDFIKRNLMGFQPERVLDVGASRGAFAKVLVEWNPDIEYVGYEPDDSLTDDWWMLPFKSQHVYESRIEEAAYLP